MGTTAHITHVFDNSTRMQCRHTYNGDKYYINVHQLPSLAVHSVSYWFFDNVLNTITYGRTLQCRVEIIIQIFHLYS